jgi:hypothetical protein
MAELDGALLDTTSDEVSIPPSRSPRKRPWVSPVLTHESIPPSTFIPKAAGVHEASTPHGTISGPPS